MIESIFLEQVTLKRIKTFFEIINFGLFQNLELDNL